MATLTTSYQKIGTSSTVTFGSAKGYLELYAKYNSQSTANNTTNWSIEARLVVTTGYIGDYTGTELVLSGTNISSTQNCGTGNFKSKTLGSASGTTTHNTDGTKSVSASAKITFKAWGKSISVSGSANLPTIPRYTSITGFSVSKRNETSFTFNWSTANTVDYVWYSTNNGSSWTGVDVTDGTSGSFTVSGLSPNTTYNCKLRVRRKDSQLTTDSSTVAQTTYKAPTTSLNSKTETSITMNWSCDTTVNHIWYSKDNGANWVDVGNVNATSGSYTISGLSANTSYNIKTRVRRSATNTTYDSATSNQTTYAYPYCTEAPNFTIGNDVTLKLYNPLNRTVQIQMWSYASQQFVSELIEISGTSYTGFSDVASRLYASIPNAKTSQYNIDVWYGTNKAIKEGGIYSINNTEVPIFTDFDYEDVNTAVTNVTGDNQVLVKNLSNIKVTIDSTDKMIVQNSATGTNYVITIDNINDTILYSDNTIYKEIGSVASAGTQRLNVKAYDSRSLSTLAYKDVVVYDYVKPVINASIERLNNFESQTTLRVNGTYTPLIINNVEKNSISRVQYRYREIGENWTSWTNLTVTTDNGNFSCNDIILSLSNIKAFEVEVQAIDSLQQTTVSSLIVDKGQAIFFISTNNETCYIKDKEVLTNDYVGNVAITGDTSITGIVEINNQEVIMYDIVEEW